MKRKLTELEKQSAQQSTDFDQAKKLLEMAINLRKVSQTNRSFEALLTDAKDILLGIDSSRRDREYFLILVMVNTKLAQYFFRKHNENLENTPSEKYRDALNSASLCLEQALKNMELLKTLHGSSDVKIQEQSHALQQKISNLQEKISQSLRGSATQTTSNVKETEEDPEEVESEIGIDVPVKSVEEDLETEQSKKGLKLALSRLDEGIDLLAPMITEQLNPSEEKAVINPNCLTMFLDTNNHRLRIKNQLAELTLTHHMQNEQNKTSMDYPAHIEKVLKQTESVLENTTKQRENWTQSKYDDERIQPSLSLLLAEISQIEIKARFLKSQALICLSQYHSARAAACEEEATKMMNQFIGNTDSPPSDAPTSTASTEPNTTSIYSSGLTSFDAPSSTASTSTTQDVKKGNKL